MQRYSILKSLFIILTLSILGLINTACSGDSMKNLDIIKSTYEGKSSQENGQSLQKHLSSDAVWTEAAGFPYAGTYVGFEEVSKQVFQRLGSEWIDYKFIVENYVADGDTVVAYGTYSGTYKQTKQYFEARVAHLWKLQNGKIISFEQFVDSVPVVKATIDE